MTYRIRTLLTLLAVALGLAAVVLFGIALSHSLVGALAAVDQGREEQGIPSDLSELTRMLRQWSAFVLAGAILARLASRIPRLDQRNWQPLNNALWTFVCTGFLLWYLSRLSYIAAWYPLDVLIENSGTLDVFSRRPLFVWPTRWLHQVAPGLSYLRLYWMVQAPVILATMLVVRKWSALFMDESKAYLGQILTVFLLAPMFSYYTFFDIGVVFFYTAGLLAIWNRAYLWLAFVVGVGALNHENILLLVFVAGVCVWGEPRRTVLKVMGWPLLAWLAARVAISIAVPSPKTFHLQILTNLWELLHAPGAMLFTALAWLPLVLLTVAGWKAAPMKLRKMAALAIPLLVVTYLFGKVREARLLDAYIPVAVAFGVGALGGRRTQEI